ncbi:MAG: hypothetical protein ACEPOW_12570 [Bacteroidales bacterium]
MKKFIIRLSIFLGIFLLVDKMFYPILMISPNKEVDRRLEEVIKGNINKDIVILGSSRGARDILAKQMEEDLGISCYNLSYLGSDVVFHEFILKSLLKFNKKPKLLILTIDDSVQFMKKSPLTFRYERLYPLIKYKYIHEELCNRNQKNKLLSDIFVLHKLNRYNFRFRKKHFSRLDSIKPNGSMPIRFQSKGREWNFVKNHVYNKEWESDERVKSFQNIQRICKEENIPLLIVSPPNFRDVNTLFQKRVKELCLPNVSQYWANPSIFDSVSDRKYFHDENHLVLRGSKIFTRKLSSFIRNESDILPVLQ